MRVRVEAPEGPPVEVEISGLELLIGRSPAAGLVLPDLSVSRQHARLVRRDGTWRIEPISQTNPTFLNESLIGAPAEVRPGDALRFGQTVLRILGAPAVGTARPREETARQEGRLRTLNAIHHALAAPISLSALLDLILERCFEALQPEEGVIMLRSPAGTFETAASRQCNIVGGDVTISRRIVAEVATKGQSVLVLDAALDERFSGSESLMMAGVRSVLAAPLSDADGTMGLIAVCSRVSARQFSQEDLAMLESIAAAAALRVRNVGLAEEAAARRVLERELALAHTIQMSMLPRRMPDRPEVVLGAALKPARSVGGDLYDYVLDGDRLWFIVADVAGKGVGAALYMAVAKTLFRATAHGEAELGAIVARINQQLSADNDEIVFVTALVGHLTLSTGEVALLDAGHNPGIRIDREGRCAPPDVPKCLALGVLADAEYEAGHFTLEAGEMLLLYTDGATDARDPNGAIFGPDRFDQAV
ncbi:MAG TPA: SpoIIE family protein phosphatase, partial [Vicinamibacterales bacterium]|nr:SpoIIE family protein phosphatase [Vicinamibacterales bacterium]